jgi:glycosyltransferase involved in cell wall biosynthesis
MRILHVSSWFQPILGYSEFHLPAAQKRLGHEVAVLTSDRYFPFPDYESTVGRLMGPRVVGAGEGMEEGLHTYRSRVRFEIRHHLILTDLKACLGTFRPDVVHVHEAFTLPVVQCAHAVKKGAFRLLVASSMEPEVFYPQSALRAAYYGLHRLLFAGLLRRRVDAFTAVGPGALHVLERQLRLPAGRARVVPLGADSARFCPDPARRETFRRQLGIDSGAVVIAYAGKLIPDKDVHILAEAFALLPKDPLVILLLVGNGPPEFVERLRERLGAAVERVRFCPAVANSELPDYFRAADIGVWPSQSSNAALEASLCALPIIVNDAPTVAHYIGGDNGLSFPRGDVPKLSKLLAALAGNAEERRRLGENGRTYGARHFSWDAIARTYLGMYGARDFGKAPD